MREKLVVAIIVIILIGSTGLLVKRVAGSNVSGFSWQLPSFSSLFSKNSTTPTLIPLVSPDLLTSTPGCTDWCVPSPTPSPTGRTMQYIPSPKPTPAPVACLKFKITHLDGSTSNLCYTQADYNQLQNLSFQLSSAKTFYQFHLDGVQKYQEEYEKTGSSIYLDAKASSQTKADAEKVKIDQITVAMYTIEQKGW